MAGGRAACSWLRFHLGDYMLHQPENTVEVDRERRAPLLVRHPFDRNILHRPDAMVRHKDVDSPEMLNCLRDQ